MSLSQEGPQELVLVVKIPTYGTQEHLQKLAADVRRILEVKMASDNIEVWMGDDSSGLSVTVPVRRVDWPPVQPS